MRDGCKEEGGRVRVEGQGEGEGQGREHKRHAPRALPGKLLVERAQVGRERQLALVHARLVCVGSRGERERNQARVCERQQQGQTPTRSPIISARRRSAWAVASRRSHLGRGIADLELLGSTLAHRCGFLGGRAGKRRWWVCPSLSPLLSPLLSLREFEAARGCVV